MFAVEFDHPSGRLAFTIVLLALSSNHALAQALWMFPGLCRMYHKNRVQEVAFVDIDSNLRLAFVAKRKSRPPMLLMDVYGQKKQAGGRAW